MQSQKSNSQQQFEQLEMLLCEKVQNGEDISPCLQALNYWISRDTKDEQLQKIWTEIVKERSVFSSLQRVIILVFAILGFITVFDQAFKSFHPAQAFNHSPTLRSDRS